MNRLKRILPQVLVTMYLSLHFCHAQDRPNILIIYTDDQGYGDVSVLNPDAKFRTPNIDRIATEGIIFTDGHSSDGVCSPSRYSLLTGRYSWRTRLKQGVLGADGPGLIEKDRMTLASLLKANGYQTAMVGKWHLNMEFEGEVGEGRDWSRPFTDGPVDRGFDYFFGIPASMNFGILTYLENDRVLDPPVLWTKKKNDITPRTYRMTPPYEESKGEGNAWVEVAPSFNDELVLETFAAKAVQFISKASVNAKNGKPFFLYLPLTSPHLPHCTHPDFQGRSSCGNYGDFMEETDYRVGQVLDALDKNGLTENTLVIFTSDNGAETNYAYQRDTYAHYSCMNFKGGKRDIYEGGHRVPFLMRWPKAIGAGRSVDIPVCQSDFLATIAEIIGAHMPDNAGEDSYSLLPVLKSDEYPGDLRGPLIHHSSMGYFAIRQGKWKLNMLRGSGGSLEPRLIQAKTGEAPYELYNVEDDPGETTNLYFQHPKIVEGLIRKITAIIENGRSTPGAPQNYVKENWKQLTWMSEPFPIYISPSGDDHASGDRQQPILSLGEALERSASLAGKREVHIILEDGIYYLDSTVVFKPGNSGTQAYPVVLRAENEGKAIISGGQKLNLDWEPFKDGIYRARVAEDVSIDQLYVNGERQRMARFPNAVEGKNVFDTWDLVHTSEPDPGNDPLETGRIASWEHPEGAYLHAMHKALWGDMHWLVKGKNADGTLDMEGGWQNNRPSPMHPRYRMVENIFEELDTAGEWFYNKAEAMLYYYPGPDVNLDYATIEIVRLKHLMEFRGTRPDPVSFIRLEGLVFRHSARSFMENNEPLLRSDWTTYRGGALFLNGTEDCLISDCEFDQLGGNSIFVNNYNRRITVRSCYIHHSGANGIAFVGDPGMVRSPIFRYGKQDFTHMDRTPGPLGDNYPSDCRVEDCLIRMTGRYEKQTSPVQVSMSHKITISHCSIYDVPRAGINISEGTFGGHTIEFCDVFNTVLETGDHGSFNSWGRDRFWTPDIKETATEVALQPDLPILDMLGPNTIRNSRWRCDHGWDIDLDDGSSWYRIYNNVLLNGGLKMREGYDRIATNNIILNNSLHPHVWFPESGDVFKGNIVYGAYRPAVMTRGMPEDAHWGAQLDSNLFATSEADRLKFSLNGCDENSLVGDPLFLDPEEGDYRVQDQSPALRLGFENFPMDEFGVRSEKLRKIARQPGIPVLISELNSAPGLTYEWLGARVKNIETPGEQSAAGLPSISGVILLEVPGNSACAEYGFQTSDVIIVCESQEVQNYARLKELTDNSRSAKSLNFVVFRNQKEQNINTL